MYLFSFNLTISEFLVYFLILLGSIILIKYHWCRRNLYKFSRNVETLKGLPLVGYGYKMVGTAQERCNIFMTIFDSFSDIGNVWFGQDLFYCIKKPEYFEIILNHPAAQHKAANVYKIAGKTLGNGLITSSVDMWKTHRKMLSPAFSQLQINQFCPIISQKSIELIEIFSNEGCKDNFDLLKYIVNGMYDIVCATNFQTNSNALKTNQNYSDLFHKLFDIVSTQMTTLWYYSDFIFKQTDLFKMELKCQAEIRHLAENITKQKMNEFLTGDKTSTKPKKPCVIDILIQKHLENKISMDDLLDHVITFLLAGTDTNALGTSFVITMLAMHPTIQDKLYEEIMDVLGPDRHHIEIDDLPNFKYLHCIIKETLRLFPGAPFIARQLQDNIQLTDKITLPKDSIQLLGFLAMHRNENYWPNPLIFDPDRFLPENSQNRHAYSWLPFSGGPRNCIGIKFGMLTMKIIVALLVQQLKFTSTYKSVEDVKLMVNIVTQPVDGFKVKCERRPRY